MILKERMNMKNWKRQKGFTLAELMVGMGIGLFGVLVMSNFYISFNKDRSRAVNGSNALNNSKLAMAVIESDLRNAGYGLTANGGMGCETTYGNYAGTNISDLTTDGILIHDSTGYNSSDEIVIQYASGSNGVGGGLLRSAYASGGSEMYPTQVFGCNVKDVILLAAGKTCALQQVTAVDKSSFKITIQENKEFNPPSKITSSWPTFAIDSNTTCLGGFNRLKYRVKDGVLEKETFPQAYEPVVENVVAMKAQYGVSDSPSSNDVTQWVSATGDWATITPERRQRIKSIRIGFVMRNTEIEKEAVSQECDPELNVGVCIWQSNDENNPPPELNIVSPTNWQNYRYITLSTIVPLKNMVWN